MASSKPPGDVRSADLELAGRIRAGDGVAFEELYRQHATRLYNLAYRMAGSPVDAEDLLQDIFLLAYRKLGSFRGESSLGTWLYRLAHEPLPGRAAEAARRAWVSRPTRWTKRMRCRWPRPPALGAVSRIDLERAIETLPPACRAAFLLHDVEGFGHEEVGTILGISEGTSKSQVHKARLRIRQYLTQSH